MTEPIIVRRLTAAAYGRLGDAFADLAGRAGLVNPHMAPAAVLASASRGHTADIVVLCAWHVELLGMERLVGVWALRKIRGARTGFAAALQAPLVPLYEVSSAPVLDREQAGEAAQGLLRTVAASPDLPKLVDLPVMPVEDEAFAALRRGCEAVGARILTFEQWQRPVMRATAADSAESYLRRTLGAGFKKRMQQFRQLERAGALRFERHRSVAAPLAFERFLALEVAGWKGESGTALAQRPADADYMRELVSRFAGIDGIRIDLLLLDGEAIAAGVLLELAGVTTFLKIAYDERHARLSPGRALAIAMLRADLAQAPPALFDSGAGDRVDASTYVWGERQPMAHVMIALGGRRALAARLAQRLRMLLRDWRDRRAAASLGTGGAAP